MFILRFIRLIRKIKVNSVRRGRIRILLPLLAVLAVTWCGCWWFAEYTSKALLPPRPPYQDLRHLRRNRSLKHYLDNIQLLIEPSSAPCSNIEEVPVIIMVASSPPRHQHREAIRRTWAKHQPTYFLIGQGGADSDWLADNYIEAKQYSDMVVYDFTDHYENLTLKTALMMQWVLKRCPHAQYMMKTDDDVLINPWTLDDVMLDNRNAKLLGYRFNNRYLHRDVYNKWYLPRWLCPQDLIPQSLAGAAYIISGEYLQKILKKAHQTPLIHLEDVFFTYLVANKALGLDLSHDDRLSPYKPWVGLDCAYWTLASMHGLNPEQMLSSWSRVTRLTQRHKEKICNYFKTYLFSNFLLY